MVINLLERAAPPTRALALLAFVSIMAAAPSATVPEGPTSDRANSYDDAWQSSWVSHARSLLTTAGKTDGFVLEIGDSITHSFAFAIWPQQGEGKTPADAQAIGWARATSWGSDNFDVTQKNGWYLAGADTTAYRGMTASGGLSVAELVSGCCNGGPAMPASTIPLEAQNIVSDAVYTANLQIDTVISAFRDAQFAVIMLGTNDPANSQNIAALTTIVDTLEAQRIVPILCTIPPRNDAFSNEWNVQFNAAVTQLAQTRNLPLIDFYQEILLRRPGTSWIGTLISADGVHPTASGNGFSANSNPYLPGGDPATHTTGDALSNVGYLLRSWLVVQKLKEVKQYVIDGDTGGGNAAPAVTLTAPASGATYTSPATVALAATASDSDGSIATVEFYANGSLVGTDTTSPYQATWSNVPAGNYSLIAKAVDNLGAATESTATMVSVSAPAPESTMHVGDLDGGAVSSAKQYWRGTVTVAIHDAAEAALSGAAVSGRWSGGYSGTGACTSDSVGRCSVTTGNIHVKKGTATFTVTGVSHPTSVYNANANHDVDGGSNGSTITVRKP